MAKELLVLFELIVAGVEFLSQLFDLYFVIGGVKELSFGLFEAHSEHLDLVGETFDLNGLEDNHKIDAFSEVALLVVGKVLDTRSVWGGNYLRRSSP